MKITETPINDLLILEPKVYGDNRGYFMESFKTAWWEERFPVIKFIQDNESKSSRGVLRGLHFQHPPYAQSKLVRAVTGEILDIAVDIRSDSSTYGRWESVVLSESNKKQLFMPPGFAHGFVVLSEFAIVQYKVDNVYAPEYEDGIRWNDDSLNIDWKIGAPEVKLSEKDLTLSNFDSFNTPF